MNLTIPLYVLISFVIAFTIFSYVMFSSNNTIQTEEPLPTNMENYLSVQQSFFSKIDPSERNVFILGSSYIMALDTVQIHNNLLTSGKDYQIYNLSIFGDSIQKRTRTVDMIISAKPEVVVYGIAEDDFSDPVLAGMISAKPKSPLPDTQEIFDNGFDAIEEQIGLDFPDSPKTITWINLRQLMGTKTNSDRYTPYPNTPFMKISEANTVAISDLELKNLLNYLGPFGNIESPQNNAYLKSLKQALTQLRENNIKVVLFVVPHHDYMLSSAPSEYKEQFNLILNNIKDDGYSVYERNRTYSELPVWHDLTHVAVNKNSVIFSDDVSKIIKEVLE